MAPSTRRAGIRSVRRTLALRALSELWPPFPLRGEPLMPEQVGAAGKLAPVARIGRPGRRSPVVVGRSPSRLSLPPVSPREPALRSRGSGDHLSPFRRRVSVADLHCTAATRQRCL